MTSQTTKECQKGQFCQNIPIISLPRVIYSIRKLKNQENIKNIKKKLRKKKPENINCISNHLE
jgi:hypothetical protein